MKSGKVRNLVAAAAVAAVADTAVWAAEPYPRLGADVVPLEQAVVLTVDPAQDGYRGEVTVELEVKRPTATVRFHARGGELGKVELADAAGRPWAVETSRDGEVVTLTAARPLAPGRYRLAAAFSQAYNRRGVGLYKTEFGGDPYLFTQLEAVEAREAFPCWDEPAFKIPWSLTLVVPENLTALTNMPVRRSSREGTLRRVEFATSPPMPSYLVAMAVGPFEFVEVKGTSIPTRIVTAKGQSALAAAAARETPSILAALERWFARPYPYAKLDLIAVPEFPYGAMENPGLITFADGVLLRDERQLGPAELGLLVQVTAHEIAHIWFGDLVTMHWWDDLWLNEAFADWMADKITAELRPELESAVEEIERTNGVLSGDAFSSQPPLRPAGEAAATPEAAMHNVGAIYDKGSAVLAMTERWLGEAAFRQGVLDYLAAHAWRNATGPDLWNALGKASGKDVAAVLGTFIGQSGAPLVAVERLPGGDGRRVRFSQRRYVRAGDTLAPLAWRVPLLVRYRDAAGLHEWSGELAGATLEATLPGDGTIAWLLPNAESAGYYRWTVSERDLEALVAAAAQDLTPRERVGLVGNLRALLDAGELRGASYLAHLGRLLADPEPAVLRAVVAGLDAAGADLVPDEAADEYAAFLRHTAGPLARAIGFRPASGEAASRSLLRPKLLELVGERGADEAVRAEARRLADAAVKDPAAIDDSVADTVFELAAHDGDRARWEDYRRRFEAASSPGERGRYLVTLGQFGDPALVRATLDYALTDKVRPTELPRLLYVVAFEAHREGEMLDWLTSRWDEVTQRLPPFIVPLLPGAGGGCSAERWQRAQAFFAEPAHRVPGTEVQLEKTGQRVAACLALREREGAAVASWLAARAEPRG